MKPTDVATTANLWNSIQCVMDGFNDEVTTFNPAGTTLSSGKCFGNLFSQIFDTFLA